MADQKMALVAPQGQVAVPQGQVVVPQGQVAVPLDQAAVPPDQRTVPLGLVGDLEAIAPVVPGCLLQVEESVEVELLAVLLEGQLPELEVALLAAVLTAVLVVLPREVLMEGL